MHRFEKALIASFVVLVVACGSFYGGIVFQQHTGVVTATGSTSTDLLKLVEQVHGIIIADALKPSSEESMTTNAIDGLLRSLGDQYALYLDPEANREFDTKKQGEFYGIGITVGVEEGTPTVIAVFDGAPAKKAGLKPGDAIVSIDGVRKAKWDLEDVVNRIRGPEGTEVELGLLREGASRLIMTKVTREKIVIPNVSSEMMGKDVGYIRLREFNVRTASDMSDAIRALERKGAKGFILDLRENGGGLLNSAVEVSSLFIKSGVIVRVDERGKPETKQLALGSTVTDKPLVVLIDGHSASASEIVAGALQDHHRAVMVGETSFGKGSVQIVRQLSNGGAGKRTNAHYLTPNSRVIDGKGVKPDYVVKMDIHDQADQATDTQLKKALQVLRSKL